MVGLASCRVFSRTPDASALPSLQLEVTTCDLKLRRVGQALGCAFIAPLGIGVRPQVSRGDRGGSGNRGQVLTFNPLARPRHKVRACLAPCASSSPARFTTSPRAATGGKTSLQEFAGIRGQVSNLKSPPRRSATRARSMIRRRTSSALSPVGWGHRPQRSSDSLSPVVFFFKQKASPKPF
jgi:hypothetical protein